MIIVVTVQQDCFYGFYHTNSKEEDVARSESDPPENTSPDSTTESQVAVLHTPPTSEREMYFHSCIDHSTGWLTEPTFGYFSESPVPSLDGTSTHPYTTNVDACRFFNLTDESAADTNKDLVRGRFMNLSYARIEGGVGLTW